MFKNFIEFIKQLGYDLFYENRALSLSKLAACWGYLVYTISSIYLMITGQTWSHYTEFSTYMAGTSTLILTGNKFINSKYNTVQGGFGTSDGTIDSGGRRNSRYEPPSPTIPSPAPIENGINKLNESINTVSNKYEEYKEQAQHLSQTIDSAKETAGKIGNGISTLTGISIRDGINLASLKKNNKSKE